MGLSGLEIFKHLPKKNCKECNVPTCLAFAMNLASGKASLDDCPYISDEAREILDSASAPPMALVKVGKGDREIVIGEETELFRHDKKFYHETAVAVRVDDTLSEVELKARVKDINALVFQRVGLEYRVQMVAVNNVSGDPGQFKECVQRVAADTDMVLLLESEDPGAVEAGLDAAGSAGVIICAATTDNYDKMVQLAQKAECPLVVRGKDLNELAELVPKVTGAGHKQIILDSGARHISQCIADLTQMRRLAIKEKFRPFGYPSAAFTSGGAALDEVFEAASYISKYAGLVVLNTCDKAYHLPLLTWRQNLYTDPQVPIQVKEDLYSVGEVTEESPVYITTNFSLTYYSVEAEVESSKIPSYILPVDTDGTSVLTAYAAGKFEPEKIAQALEKYGVKDKVKNPSIIIPGYVAVLYAKLKDLTGFNIMVGPQEATAIPTFARSNLAEGA